MRSWRLFVTCAAAVVMVASATGCGKKETPFDRVTRLRQQYEVRPNAYQTRTAEDGTPELVLDLFVVNTGKEGLDTLTVLVRVVGEDGQEKAERRVSVDVAGLRTGVSEQLTAVVPGIAVDPGDSVFLEVENVPPDDAIEDYPEYRNAVS